MKTESLFFKSGVAFLLRTCGVVLAFLFNMLIARFLGVEGVGAYYIAISITNILAVVFTFGIDVGLLKYVSYYMALQNGAEAKNVFIRGFIVCVVLTTLVSVILSVYSEAISSLFFDSELLGGVLSVMAFAVVTKTLITILSATLSATQSVAESVLVSGVLYPFFALLMVMPAVWVFHEAGVPVAFVAANGGAVLVGWFMVKDKFGSSSNNEKVVPTTKILKSLSSMWPVAVVTKAITPWAPLLLLGVIVGDAGSGVFAMVLQLASSSSFALQAVMVVVSPQFAQLYAAGRMKKLAFLGRKSVWLTAVFCMPLQVLLVVFSGKVLLVFGSGFSEGELMLQTLVIGHIVGAFIGPTANILLMTGSERLARNATYLSATVLILSGPILAYYIGSMGMAIAVALSLVIHKVIAALFLWRRHKIVVTPVVWRFLKGAH